MMPHLNGDSTILGHEQLGKNLNIELSLTENNFLCASVIYVLSKCSKYYLKILFKVVYNLHHQCEEYEVYYFTNLSIIIKIHLIIIIKV